MRKLLLSILSIFYLFFMFSCRNNRGNGISDRNDTLQQAVMQVTTKPKKNFDYKKLYGRWIPISEHYSDTLVILNGGYRPMLVKKVRDTNVDSFVEDTNKYLFKFAAYYRFDTAGNYENGESDVVRLGRYKIDSLKYAIEFMEYNRKNDSILYSERIMYLDDKYMLTERRTDNEKILKFYLKTTRTEFGWGG